MCLLLNNQTGCLYSSLEQSSEQTRASEKEKKREEREQKETEQTDCKAAERLPLSLSLSISCTTPPCTFSFFLLSLWKTTTMKTSWPTTTTTTTNSVTHSFTDSLHSFTPCPAVDRHYKTHTLTHVSLLVLVSRRLPARLRPSMSSNQVPSILGTVLSFSRRLSTHTHC